MEAHCPADLKYELKVFRSGDAKRLFKEQIIERDGGQCQYCGCTSNLTLDHIRPKSKGGRYEASNLVTACLKCNQSKGSSHWLSWWVGQEHFDHSNFSKVLSWTTG